jgi:hypothetical protein
MMSGHRRPPDFLFFIFYFFNTDRSSQPPQSLFNISSKPTMNRCTIDYENRATVSHPPGAITHNETLLSYGSTVLLSVDGSNTSRNTQQDARACDSKGSKKQQCSRNQGIIDERTKCMHEKLYIKLQRRRNTQAKIDKLNTLMQNVSDNTELYKMYASRKAELEVQL